MDIRLSVEKICAHRSNALKRGLYALLLGLGIAVATFAVGHQAFATLGEPADSITSDGEALSAKRLSTVDRSDYYIREVTAASTVVREYVSPSGIVFGIAWNGLMHPSLTKLLGKYSDEYHQALQQTQRHQGRRRLQVETGRVVVQKWGHMRNLQGRAYVPALIPQGVSVDEIR